MKLKKKKFYKHLFEETTDRIEKLDHPVKFDKTTKGQRGHIST